MIDKINVIISQYIDGVYKKGLVAIAHTDSEEGRLKTLDLVQHITNAEASLKIEIAKIIAEHSKDLIITDHEDLELETVSEMGPTARVVETSTKKDTVINS